MRLPFVLLTGLVVSTHAAGNDSSAELATGGLVFLRNDAIEMRAEDLYISAEEIRVRYRFFNKTDADVTLTVAFPMPEVRVDSMDQNISLPTDDPVNLLGFVTRVNGQPVATQVEQRTSSGGTDRTAMLTRLGIPLAPHLQSTNRALDRLPREQWDELIRAGLADIEEYDVGKGMEKHLSARWTLQTTFHWRQTFPARAETVIDHRYKPSVGMSAGTMLGAPSSAREPWVAEYVRKYCIENSIFAALDRRRRAAGQGESSPPYFEQRIDYVLQTGANWSGPIGDFRLVIDKGDGDSLVTFCGDGVKKIGPTQFEMRKTDFVPQGNFSVLILKKQKRQ